LRRADALNDEGLWSWDWSMACGCRHRTNGKLPAHGASAALLNVV
jgi:hypothetical protein